MPWPAASVRWGTAGSSASQRKPGGAGFEQLARPAGPHARFALTAALPPRGGAGPNSAGHDGPGPSRNNLAASCQPKGCSASLRPARQAQPGLGRTSPIIWSHVRAACRLCPRAAEKPAKRRRRRAERAERDSWGRGGGQRPRGHHDRRCRGVGTASGPSFTAQPPGGARRPRWPTPDPDPVRRQFDCAAGRGVAGRRPLLFQPRGAYPDEARPGLVVCCWRPRGQAKGFAAPLGSTRAAGRPPARPPARTEPAGPAASPPIFLPLRSRGAMVAPNGLDCNDCAYTP